MRQQSRKKISISLRTGLITLAAVFSALAGASGLIYSSPYSPLIVGGFIAAVIILIKWLQKPVWALYAAIFMVLLPIGLIPQEINSLLNRSLTVAAFCIWFFYVLVNRQKIRFTNTTILMFGFLAWGIITLFWISNLSIGIQEIQVYTMRLILFLILIVNEVRTKENLNTLMNLLALIGWLLILATFITILLNGYTPGTRLQVFDMNENGEGILALLTMSGVIWHTIHAPKHWKLINGIISYVFILFVIVLTALSGSRGSTITLLITLLALFCWKSTRPWGILGVLIIAIGAVFAPFLFTTVIQRFAITSGDTLLGNREIIWKATWMLILDNMWGGVGIGNAPYEVMPILNILTNVVNTDHVAIHNPVLAIWAETGIPGLLLYLGILGSAIWSFGKQFFRYKGLGMRSLLPYFALISSIFLGYMASWIKGGGMESDFSFFLILALLLIPANLDTRSFA